MKSLKDVDTWKRLSSRQRVCAALCICILSISLLGVIVNLAVRFAGQQPKTYFKPAQFTSELADWSRLNTKVDHSPLSSWPRWNGDIVDASRLKGKQINQAACEGGIVRGMYQAFPNPFVDPFNPTKGEVDTYNNQIIVS
jgi:hypothetical protein